MAKLKTGFLIFLYFLSLWITPIVQKTQKML